MLLGVLCLPGAALAVSGAPGARPAVSRASAATVATAARRARGLSTTRTIHYRGLTLRVPAAWPVFHLTPRSTVCVRFNRHAVYLGTPGTDQRCPQRALGRTEALLVTPSSYRGAPLTPVSRLAAAPGAGSMLHLTDRRRHLAITATWRSDPDAIRTALGIASLRRAALATNGHVPKPATAPPPGRHPLVTTPESPATPGEVYAGLGFDVCSTPSAATMSAWGVSSPYAAIGIYIGGANAACLGGNLNAAWVGAESAAGWHMIPIYVGLQSPQVNGRPTSSCGGCAPMSATPAVAATQGTAAAQDAVAQAQALGIGTANPIYYDLEGYARSATATAAVLAFLQAWTVQLHASGYLAGVYSSGSSGITDLVSTTGTGYVEPDDLWTADWSTTGVAPTSPANPYVPLTDWAGGHQLLQYYSDAESATAPYETWGNVRLEVDRDYIDAATAAYGSATFVAAPLGTPTLTIRPQVDGSVNLSARWPGAPGVMQFSVLAGPSPQALNPVATIPALAHAPARLAAVYPYYEVQALNSLGQVVGTSTPVQPPGGLAIFGRSAYVGPTGPVGIPTACPNLAPCELAAEIFDGRRRIAHSDPVHVSPAGGQLLVPLNPGTRRLVTTARHLPVTVRITSSTGVRATRPLTLVAYTVSGRRPTRRIWPSGVLQILGSTSYVSNGWTGGVLALCRASVPCVSTARVTLGGATLAFAHTTTLGPGEVGYLTYALNGRGHRLLVAAPGNQLGARLTVHTVAPGSPSPTSTSTSGPAPQGSGGASIASAGTTTMALLSLVSFR